MRLESLPLRPPKKGEKKGKKRELCAWAPVEKPGGPACLAQRKKQKRGRRSIDRLAIAIHHSFSSPRRRKLGGVEKEELLYFSTYKTKRGEKEKKKKRGGKPAFRMFFCEKNSQERERKGETPFLGKSP